MLATFREQLYILCVHDTSGVGCLSQLVMSKVAAHLCFSPMSGSWQQVEALILIRNNLTRE